MLGSLVDLLLWHACSRKGLIGAGLEGNKGATARHAFAAATALFRLPSGRPHQPLCRSHTLGRYKGMQDSVHCFQAMPLNPARISVD